jgi:hypothetical protein
MSITAIIPHYWDSRREQLGRIVAALRSGELAPERVIVWNNMPDALSVEGAEVINAGRNWGIAARFAAAYLARTEYVFFQDNDLMVQWGTLKNLMAFCPGEGESLELQGRNFGPWHAPYSQSCYVTNPPECQIVHVGLSRVSLMKRSTAMNLARVIPPDVTDDDLWTSRYCKIRIVPAGAAEGYLNLTETEGLSQNAVAHVLRRDDLVRELWPERIAECLV